MPQGTGIVVGRFQIDQLHKGHEAVIKQALDECEVVFVFVGCLTLDATARNPLNYEARRQMIKARFSYVEPDRLYVLQLKDTTGGDKLWLDTAISKMESFIGPQKVIRGYGSRDSSFLRVLYDKDSNQGRISPIVVSEIEHVSATAVREEICNTPYFSTDMRRGIIHAKGTGYPAVYPVIDCLIWSPSKKCFLIGKRAHEDKYRMVGGFFEASDGDLISCVIREVKEETGITLLRENIKHIGSSIVNDPRLAGEREKILTTLHIGFYDGEETPKGADDIAEVGWAEFDLLFDAFVPGHVELITKFEKEIRDLTVGHTNAR